MMMMMMMTVTMTMTTMAVDADAVVMVMVMVAVAVVNNAATTTPKAMATMYKDDKDDSYNDDGIGDRIQEQ